MPDFSKNKQMTRFYSIILLITIIFTIRYNVYGQKFENDTNHFSKENLYWPGNFEQGLYGGNFSSAKNVVISELENSTNGGKRSWDLKGTNPYKHIELLTVGKGEFVVKFNAKSYEELDIVIKKVFKTIDNKSQTENHTIKLPGDQIWHEYSLKLIVDSPYPGPRTGEVLITCLNEKNVQGWLDNLEIRRNSPDLEGSIPLNKHFQPSTLIQNNGFEFGSQGWHLSGSSIPVDNKYIIPYSGSTNNGHVLELSLNGAKKVSQVINAETLSGKKIRITADVGFHKIDQEAKSWAGILITLKSGENPADKLITPDPSPFWYVLGLSEPQGVIKQISAIYQIPEDIKKLYFEITVQEGIKNSIGIVDNIYLEIPNN